MAAAIKALNAKIRSNKYADYICSTRTFSPEAGVGEHALNAVGQSARWPRSAGCKA